MARNRAALLPMLLLAAAALSALWTCSTADVPAPEVLSSGGGILHKIAGFITPPPVLTAKVPVIVCAVKVVQLLLVAWKYPSSKLQPFARLAYQFSSVAAMCKILYFTGVVKLQLFQDLSFILCLTGVVVTLALDFLWALSSSIETSPLFHHDWFASDVVLTWYGVQIFAIPALASITYLPLPVNNKIALEFAITVVLWLSFGFVWFCLWKVHGASNSTEFKKAYNAALIVTAINTGLVLQNTLLFVVLCGDLGFQENFNLSEHFCETIGIFCMLCYFMFVQEQPAEIHNHMHDLDNKRKTLKHKSTLGSLVGIQCVGSIEQSTS
eukprot:CAMPEP_0195060288 /NCGR_PEP_ID=MMETSP0448-20130528/7583_1 /TAXON_ID=66468 /ORGANISM="Heterocapsa triquestra, Strain CCMP 448" /LENGTH=324 /DNA_ID=CAMNT_0040090683 /DNA_START=68 /DNA_END=1042 /DNA_ORIENTATION=+